MQCPHKGKIYVQIQDFVCQKSRNKSILISTELDSSKRGSKYLLYSNNFGIGDDDQRMFYRINSAYVACR